MSDPTPRILRFAVTGALLAGAAGCTDDSHTYTNPGPVQRPSASATPAGEPVPEASPAASPAATPAAEPVPSPSAPLVVEDVLTNPGPDRDLEKD